jgi:hypothetical protein
LWIEIIGREDVRVGREQGYWIQVGNSGNIDVEDVFVDLGIPSGFRLQRVETKDGNIIWSRDNILKDFEEGKVEFPEDWKGVSEGDIVKFFDEADIFQIPIIRSGETFKFKVMVYAPLSLSSQEIKPLVAPLLVAGGVWFAKYVGMTYVKHLIAQTLKTSVEEIADPKDTNAWEAIWETLEEATKKTIEDLDLRNWISWGKTGLEKFSEMAVKEPLKFASLLEKVGKVDSEKAVDIAYKFREAYAKNGINLGSIGKLKKGLFALEAAFKIYEKLHLINPIWQKAGKPIRRVMSYDPNDKAGPAGFGENHYVSRDQTFQYVVYFENVATANAAAQTVNITDQLDSNLDWKSLTFSDISVAGKIITIPEETTQISTSTVITVEPWNGQPATQTVKLQIKASFNPNTGLVQWLLEGRDLDTGTLTDFLVPNTNPPKGEGWVTFMVKPKPNLSSGTQIKNKATIDFDADLPPEPMNTPEVVNTIDSGAPTSSVNPLAEHQWSVNFKVSWSGKDDERGSGIRDYTIYVSDNGGAYTPWLTNTTETSAIFTGTSGHTYSFYSIARDNVGHTEEPPATFDAQTKILGLKYQVFANRDNDILLPDNRTRIFIPKGALSGDTFLGVGFPDPNTVPQAKGLQPTGVYIEISLENGQTRFLNNKMATIWIPYKDENPNDGVIDGTKIKEHSLKVFFFDGRAWVRDFETEIDAINNIAKLNTPHLTIFGLFGVIAPNLEDVIVYPNPFKPSRGDTKIRFERLTKNVTIRIYNIAGELVKMEKNILTGFFDWDAKNDSGEKVASGIYIYVITDNEGGIKKGKIAIIR